MNNHIENVIQDVVDIMSIIYPSFRAYDHLVERNISNEDLLIIEDFAEDIIKEINRLKMEKQYEE